MTDVVAVTLRGNPIRQLPTIFPVAAGESYKLSFIKDDGTSDEFTCDGPDTYLVFDDVEYGIGFTDLALFSGDMEEMLEFARNTPTLVWEGETLH